MQIKSSVLEKRRSPKQEVMCGMSSVLLLYLYPTAGNCCLGLNVDCQLKDQTEPVDQNPLFTAALVSLLTRKLTVA